ncbi:LIC12162 family transferase [Leptospira barantonii]|uniref:Transferase n=1 Tax=Leptospira barantonii TaxID=2023184 RepID=A0ABX4NPF7_9LEPT|nr:LIC12162 family protein [Leptospira barantonii]PJZ58154.1 transferase [Leptospira barantonii]
MKRYLVTTADERTWKKDVPILFLGEWCRRYDRKHVWNGLDYEVALPYGVDPKVKRNDFDYLESLRLVFLNEITEALNRLHSVSYSTRYWNLVLGHWILRYLRVFYNRYKTIEQVLDRYEISGTTQLKFDEYDLAPNDSNSLVANSNLDFWNHVICIELLKFFDFENFENVHEAVRIKTLSVAPNSKPTWKKIVLFFLNSILPSLSRKSDAFLINTYLPFQYELSLQIRLAQIPQLWRSPDLPEWGINGNLRQSFQLPNSEGRSFETFAWKMLPKAMPLCFIEGFPEILENSKSLKWPKKPRFIFTSNNFDTDENFKVWAAGKTLQGIPYIVGQHGNNYGTMHGIQNSPELVNTDSFVTWGWSRTEKHIPGFVFTKCNEKLGEYDSNGGLLLIEFPPAMRLGPEDSWFDFTKYFEEQLVFYKSLPDEIRNQTIVRLHNSFKRFDWFDEERWKDFDSNVKIDSSRLKLKELILKSRLVVHSYDSTGILETLSLNIPTLCFWRNEFTHLVEEAIPFYQNLKRVRIFHSSPQEATQFIAMNWASIDDWWYSEDVQSVRRSFCEKYAMRSKHPISTLKKILLDVSKN